VEQPTPRSASAARAAGYGRPCDGDELLAEIARDIQDGARDLARLLPSLGGEEPLRRIVQLQEQLDGLTAAVVGRARYRRVTWATVSSTLGISEDTARHRYTDRYVLRRLARFNRSETAQGRQKPREVAGTVLNVPRDLSEQLVPGTRTVPGRPPGRHGPLRRLLLHHRLRLRLRRVRRAAGGGAGAEAAPVGGLAAGVTAVLPGAAFPWA
jgi:hypothetical protein